MCNMKEAESEYHFLLVCPYYHVHRKNKYRNIINTYPNLHKFNSIINKKYAHFIKNLTMCIHIAMKEREQTLINNF